VRSCGLDLVDEVFDAGDAEFAEFLLNYFVGSKRNSLLIYFAVSSLVNESSDEVIGWVSKCDVWLNFS